MKPSLWRYLRRYDNLDVALIWMAMQVVKRFENPNRVSKSSENHKNVQQLVTRSENVESPPKALFRELGNIQHF